jgi:A/G-specific adenine glycosylase
MSLEDFSDAEQSFISTLEFAKQNDKLTSDAVQAFHKVIYAYYHNHGRKLPWRETNNPYLILVSEVMLQQTQVERVIEKYEEFIAAFPDFYALAHAPLQDIFAVWHGLGYNRRALALKKCAEIVVTQFEGMLPSRPGILVKLPGIGRYTASALAAFAFNQPTVLIETNIRTVFIHFFFQGKSNINDSELIPLVEQTFDISDPRTWYYALMDYGVMLKKRYQNPNRKSAHYRKQTPFQGSNRQLRGMVLRALTHESNMSEKELGQRLKTDLGRLRNILIQLHDEGFIRKSGDVYRIA